MSQLTLSERMKCLRRELTTQPCPWIHARGKHRPRLPKSRIGEIEIAHIAQTRRLEASEKRENRRRRLTFFWRASEASSSHDALRVFGNFDIWNGLSIASC